MEKTLVDFIKSIGFEPMSDDRAINSHIAPLMIATKRNPLDGENGPGVFQHKQKDSLVISCYPHICGAPEMTLMLGTLNEENENPYLDATISLEIGHPHQDKMLIKEVIRLFVRKHIK